MDEFLKLGTEYRYHLIDDLPGKVGGAFIQDPRRLCLELERKDYERKKFYRYKPIFL